MPKAYPVYDDVYQDHLAVIRDWLKNLPNLELAGRNGMHKYNNQDHSMMTAVLAARNILGLGQFDPWKVNTDAEYHEEGSEPKPPGRRPHGAPADRRGLNHGTNLAPPRSAVPVAVGFW